MRVRTLLLDFVIGMVVVYIVKELLELMLPMSVMHTIYASIVTLAIVVATILLGYAVRSVVMYRNLGFPSDNYDITGRPKRPSTKPTVRRRINAATRQGKKKRSQK